METIVIIFSKVNVNFHEVANAQFLFDNSKFIVLIFT